MRFRLSDHHASMGPLPKGSGRGGTGSSGTRWGSFNGAAAERQRKVVAAVTVSAAASLQWGRCRKAAEGSTRCRLRASPRCFNGAAAERQRKVDARIIIEREQALQWGRCRKAAEGHRVAVDPRVSAHASMGPLPKGSGRLPTCHLHHHHVRASMGPLPKGSGRQPHCVGGHERPGASMGPLPKGSGRSWTEEIRALCGVLLQWGRCRKAAEGQRRVSSSSWHGASMGPLPKGSGRSLLDFEIDAARQASMGPLPKGSGRRRGAPCMPIVRRALQWGRCRKAAEGSRVRRPR